MIRDIAKKLDEDGKGFNFALTYKDSRNSEVASTIRAKIMERRYELLGSNLNDLATKIHRFFSNGKANASRSDAEKEAANQRRRRALRKEAVSVFGPESNGRSLSMGIETAQPHKTSS